jgi:hypothetical protein
MRTIRPKDRESDTKRAGVVATEDGKRTVNLDLKDQQPRFIERGIAHDLRAFRDQLNDAALSPVERLEIALHPPY